MNAQIYTRLVGCNAPLKHTKGLATKKFGEHTPVVQKSITQMVNAYKNNNKQIYLLTGPSRTGKTFAACAYLIGDMKCPNPFKQSGEWDKDDRPHFVHMLDMLNFEYRHFTEWTYPGVLVLDDLGMGCGESKNIASIIYALIQKRTYNDIVTIITTQHSPQILENRYGKRFMELTNQFGEILTTGQ